MQRLLIAEFYIMSAICIEDSAEIFYKRDPETRLP